MSFPPYTTFETVTPKQDIHLLSFSHDTPENIKTLNYILNLFTIEGGVPVRNSDPMQIVGPIFYYDSIDYPLTTNLNFYPALYGRTTTSFDFENVSSNILNIILGTGENEFRAIVNNIVFNTGSYSINLLNDVLTNQGTWYAADTIDQYVSLVIDDEQNIGVIGNPDTLNTIDDINNVLTNDKTYNDITVLANYKFSTVGSNISSIEYIEKIDANTLWDVNIYNDDIFNESFKDTIEFSEISGIYYNWDLNHNYKIDKSFMSTFPTTYNVYMNGLIVVINGMFVFIDDKVQFEIDDPSMMITNQTGWILNETASQYCALVAHFNKDFIDSEYTVVNRGVEIGLIGNIENLNTTTDVNNVLNGRDFNDITIISIIEFDTNSNSDIIDINFHKKLDGSDIWKVKEFPHWRNIHVDGGDMGSVELTF